MELGFCKASSLVAYVESSTQLAGACVTHDEHSLLILTDFLCTVHRQGDDPRKECEECGNARGSNVRYYPT
jgi:hypothetical protein